MTKIDIISGFLGAGKTTLIKKLIQEAFSNEQVVLIENEFGEIGVDGAFLKDAGVRVNELNAGCICCSLVGDFSKALKQVINDYKPDRVLIEPSGVGKLSDVIKAVQKAGTEVEIIMNSSTTVVDVTKAKMYIKNFGEFFLNQIEAAGTIVLSRTQNVSQDKMNEVVSLIRDHNKEARLVTTPWDEINGHVILEAIEHSSNIEDIMNTFKYESDDDDEKECHCHHHHDGDEDDDEKECHCHHHHDGDEDDDEKECHCHHHDEDDDEDEKECHCHHHHDHHHDADDIFTSWGRETANKYSRDSLKGILDKLQIVENNPYGIILRAKGIIPDENGVWMEFDLTPGEYEIRKGTADYTGKICVIGSELKENLIAELFDIK